MLDSLYVKNLAKDHHISHGTTDCAQRYGVLTGKRLSKHDIWFTYVKGVFPGAQNAFFHDLNGLRTRE